MILLTDWVGALIAFVAGYFLLGDSSSNLEPSSQFPILIGVQALLFIILTVTNKLLENSGRNEIFGFATASAVAVVFSLLNGGLFGWQGVAFYALAGIFGIFSNASALGYFLIIFGVLIEWLIHFQDWLGTEYRLEENTIEYLEYTFWPIYMFIGGVFLALVITGALKIILSSRQESKVPKRSGARNSRPPVSRVKPVRTSEPVGRGREPEPSKATGRASAPPEPPQSQGTQIIQIVPKENQGDSESLTGVLESVVYFMSKNFKCTSSLAFLSEDMGKTFKLNAAVTNSNASIEKEVVIESGIGLLGKASQLELGLMSGNLRNYPDKLEYYLDSSHINSAVVTKIYDSKQKNVIGLLVVDSMDLQAFHDEDKNLLNRFSVIASKLISNIQMSHKLLDHNKRLELIYSVSKKISEEISPNGVLKTLMQNLKEIFPANRLILCDYQPEYRKGRVVKIIGREDKNLQSGMVFDLTNENSIYAKSFMEKTEILVEEFKSYQCRFMANDHKEVRSLMVAPITNDKDMVIALVGVESFRMGVYSVEDLTLLKTLMINSSSSLAKAQMFKNMEKLATIDGLTQIPNHRNFQDNCDKMMAKSKAEKKPMGLLLMDIDHFKKFNDTYGHPVGDLVLKQVANAIKRSIRINDFVARYGGEEFVVLLNGLDAKQAMESAERIRKGIEDLQIPTEAGTLSVTVSIGCCIYPDGAADKASLIDNADKSLYTSKENGRNQVTLFKK